MIMEEEWSGSTLALLGKPCHAADRLTVCIDRQQQLKITREYPDHSSEYQAAFTVTADPLSFPPDRFPPAALSQAENGLVCAKLRC